MREFLTGRDYNNFAASVASKCRYVFEPHVEEFIETVIETGNSRIHELSGGTILYRAQLGHEWVRQLINPDEPEGDYFKVPGAFSPVRMKPPKGSVREGRVNPKGIACLYLSDERDTALAETRPWLKSYISLGEFKILRQLKIMFLPEPKLSFDLVSLSPSECSTRLPAKTREKYVWGEIAYAFSEPVTPSDEKADYAPTQILAEAFKKCRCDGIRYKSLLGVGFSFALFDTDAADLINCTPYETKEVCFDFGSAGNSYYVPKHYPDLPEG